MEESKFFPGGRLVLVVDDHPDFCLVMEHLLSGLGFRTVIASNGHEALKTLERQKVFVVLTDLFMPRMDGLELLKRMQVADQVMPPVIAVTGDAHVAASSVGSAAANLGAKTVLIKPFSRDQLAAAISFVTNETFLAKDQTPRPM